MDNSTRSSARSSHYYIFSDGNDSRVSSNRYRSYPSSAWAKKTKAHPQKIWDDAGAGGGKPGSIWVINSYDMVAVVPGHDAPKDEYYDLVQNKFYMDQFQIKFHDK